MLTADRRRREPIKVPRPDRPQTTPGSVTLLDMARRMAAAGRVRVVQEGDPAG